MKKECTDQANKNNEMQQTLKLQMEEKAAELIRKNSYIKKLEVNLQIKSKYETNPMIPT